MLEIPQYSVTSASSRSLIHLLAWSFLSKIVNLLRTYTQIQLIIHAFYQWVNIWLVSIVSMVDSTTHLAFKTWRKSTDLSARVRIHRLLFVLTGWWWSLLPVCLALLAGLSSCTIKPLQMIQNAAARLVFSEPKRAHVTPLFVSLHWLPVAARIKFKTLMLAYRTTTGSAPTYFHSLMTIYIPSRSLRSASERRLVVPSQRDTKSLSRTFSFTVPGWWNELPTPIWNAKSLTIFKRHLKTHLFHLHLTSASFL